MTTRSKISANDWETEVRDGLLILFPKLEELNDIMGDIKLQLKNPYPKPDYRKKQDGGMEPYDEGEQEHVEPMQVQLQGRDPNSGNTVTHGEVWPEWEADWGEELDAHRSDTDSFNPYDSEKLEEEDSEKNLNNLISKMNDEFAEKYKARMKREGVKAETSMSFDELVADNNRMKKELNSNLSGNPQWAVEMEKRIMDGIMNGVMPELAHIVNQNVNVLGGQEDIKSGVQKVEEGVDGLHEKADEQLHQLKKVREEIENGFKNLSNYLHGDDHCWVERSTDLKVRGWNLSAFSRCILEIAKGFLNLLMMIINFGWRFLSLINKVASIPAKWVRGFSPLFANTLSCLVYVGVLFLELLLIVATLQQFGMDGYLRIAWRSLLMSVEFIWSTMWGIIMNMTVGVGEVLQPYFDDFYEIFPNFKETIMSVFGSILCYVHSGPDGGWPWDPFGPSWGPQIGSLFNCNTLWGATGGAGAVRLLDGRDRQYKNEHRSKRSKRTSKRKSKRKSKRQSKSKSKRRSKRR